MKFQSSIRSLKGYLFILVFNIGFPFGKAVFWIYQVLYELYKGVLECVVLRHQNSSVFLAFLYIILFYMKYLASQLCLCITESFLKVGKDFY